jgi:hypothetical protein
MPSTSKPYGKGEKDAVVTSSPFKKNLEESFLMRSYLHLQRLESQMLLKHAKDCG